MFLQKINSQMVSKDTDLQMVCNSNFICHGRMKKNLLLHVPPFHFGGPVRSFPFSNILIKFRIQIVIFLKNDNNKGVHLSWKGRTHSSYLAPLSSMLSLYYLMPVVMMYYSSPADFEIGLTVLETFFGTMPGGWDG